MDTTYITQQAPVGVEPLLKWYWKNQRDLPWRQTKDPYKIWISEIMLQQTRVDTVIGYYHRFLAQFGTLQQLAAAPEQEVLAAWQGLGYYSRALNLQKAAQQIVAQHGGIFPENYEDIRKLPGIGDYTAGAVASIAFNQPCPAVDGNVLRVICRLLGIDEDITKDRTKKEVAGIVREMIPRDHAGDFTQSLMELGALICVPSSPLCGQCPMQPVCSAHKTGRQAELPVKKKKEAPREFHYWVAVLRQNGKILLEHRKNDSLLGQLWGLPIVEKRKDSPHTRLFEEKYCLHLKNPEKRGTASHVFTHQIWKMDVYSFIPAAPIPDNELLHWVEESELEQYAIPTAFQRVLKLPALNGEWEQLELFL